MESWKREINLQLNKTIMSPWLTALRILSGEEWETVQTVAQKVILPPKGVFRVVFLYVGQGEATIMAVPDGEEHKIVLIDCHIDSEFGGINLPAMFKDLNRSIDVFINTHPHNDHLKSIKNISDVVDILEVWHSGHVPGKNHREAYDELKVIMEDLPEEKVEKLAGTTKTLSLGDVSYNILAPAEYVSDEIDDEDPETRYQRIHEQCAVLRFCYGSPAQVCVLITGDSNLPAWRNHITEYHKDRLPSLVLSASHHGSRTFFKDQEDDEPYIDHIEAIGSTYLVISAPKQDESPHGHPHDDALQVYNEYIDDENIFHLGADRQCLIVDIHEDGECQVYPDKELVDAYGGNGDDGKGSKEKLIQTSIAGTTLTSLDRKPMGG